MSCTVGRLAATRRDGHDVGGRRSATLADMATDAVPQHAIAPEDLPALDEPHHLDEPTIDAFRRDGHVAVPGLASAAEAEAYRPVVAAAVRRWNGEQRPLEARDLYGRAFLQTANLWVNDPAVRRFVFATRFAAVAATLLGCRGVRLYHDQALFKEPDGGPTPWHQDQVYWPIDDERTVTMWMPLADLDPAVGSMTFASGTHRLGRLGDEVISAESEVAFGQLVAREGLELATHGALAAGDATFHTGWTLHRAGPNPTEHMRPVMTVIYVADGAVVGEPDSVFQQFDLATWIPGAVPGDPVASELNPRLWPAPGSSVGAS